VTMLKYNTRKTGHGVVQEKYNDFKNCIPMFSNINLNQLLDGFCLNIDLSYRIYQHPTVLK
jgi:hypothetical protein